MIESGDIFFTKSVSLGSEKGSTKFELKAPVFGVLLGMVKPKTKQPTKNEVVQVMTNIGLIQYDDLVEVFGEKELETKLLPFLKEKYK